MASYVDPVHGLSFTTLAKENFGFFGLKVRVLWICKGRQNISTQKAETLDPKP